MLNVVWKNLSRVHDWFLGQHLVALPPWGYASILPQANLPAGQMATAQAQLTLPGQILVNAADAFFVWWADLAAQPGQPSVYWFATRLNQPVNAGPVGYAPYWQICAGQCLGPPAIPNLTDSIWRPGQNLFRTPTAEVAQPYSFTAQDDALPSGLRITFSPVAGGSDLSLTVVISDV
jgi:hypothetical protein